MVLLLLAGSGIAWLLVSSEIKREWDETCAYRTYRDPMAGRDVQRRC